jgi:hypothetical protein
MSETPIQAVPETDDEPRTQITIAWKPLLKKAAAYTAAALVGAGIYALATRDEESDDSDDQNDLELGSTTE